MSEGEISSETRLKEELPLSSITPFDRLFGEVKFNEFGGVKNLREETGEESQENDCCLSTDEVRGVALEGD